MAQLYFAKATTSLRLKPNKQRGQAVITIVVILLAIGLGLIKKGASLTLDDASIVRKTVDSKIAYVYSGTGLEDVGYRIRSAKQYDLSETLVIDGGSVITTTYDDLVASTKLLYATSTVANLIRVSSVILRKGDEVEFNYGIQAGNGGFFIENSASVNGNIYSNGTVIGSNSNQIRGSVVSAGPIGLVDGITSTSSVYAHTIKDSSVERDAYYQVKTNTTVIGTSYPDSPDRPTTTMSISDSMILEWEADAEEGGVISSPCPYKITANTTLGPKKINCDLELSNGAKLTIAGMIWVKGNISFKNNSGIYMDTALGSKSIALIADNPSDRTNSSKITVSNSAVFNDTGVPGSFIFLISANDSVEQGGNEVAIDLTNSASGSVVLYSNHGEVSIGNSSKLKSVTGYLITMSNNSELSYDDGLESTLFDTGPGGSWAIDSWKEVE